MPCEVLQAFGLFSVVYAIEIVAIGYVCLRRPHAIVRRCVYDCGYMVRVITTIRMDERLHEGIKLLAAAAGRSLSNMIEALVRQGLEDGGRSSSSRPRPGATPWGGTTPGVFR